MSAQSKLNDESITLGSQEFPTSNHTTRKISFKTHRNATTAGCYANRKIVTNGIKVAQIAQRFNQLIKKDLILVDEVKKRGAVVLHRPGDRLIEIAEEKTNRKITLSNKKSSNEDITDDVALLSTSTSKTTKKKKCSSGKRPSFRILTGKDVKCGNVSSKRQLFEMHIVNKNMKPRVPVKSQQVLAKTKEMQEKKLQTETTPCPDSIHNKTTTILPLEECKDDFYKMPVKPSFLYATKCTKLEAKLKVHTIDGDKEGMKQLDAVPKNDEVEDELTDINLDSLFINESESLIDISVESTGLQNDVLTKSESDETMNYVKPNESFLFRSQFDGGKIDDCTSILNSQETGSLNFTNLLNDKSTRKNSDESISNMVQCEFKDSEIAGIYESDTSGEENIYQSLCEVKLETGSVKSYESFENYDVVGQHILDNTVSQLVMADKAPKPPPPRRNTLPRISSPILTSTTSTLIQSPQLEKSEYGKSSYNQLSILRQRRHEKNGLRSKHIYDTIQSRFCGDDNFNSNRHEWKNPLMNDSGLSNSYDSFSLKNSSYSTINQILRHAISSQTLSSEHRINSIYGHSLTPTSDKSASDNSDEWVDLSDEDKVDNTEHDIIV